MEFNTFFFGNNYKWSLAFYKLCAFNWIVHNTEYRYYSYLDADVYCQRSFANIWKECDEHIMMLDISHGLSDNNYQAMLYDYELLVGKRKLITHFGGEFFASNRDNALLFLTKENAVFDAMVEKNIRTSAGDEFILSCVADELGGYIKNASAYVARLWTGIYRIITTAYKYEDMVILHCPAEKNNGIIKLFDNYIGKGKVPSTAKAHHILHLNKRSLRCRITMLRVAIRSGKIPIR